MAADIPSESGKDNKDEGQEDQQRTGRLWLSRNLETGDSHLLMDKDETDPDTGAKSKRFWIIGKLGKDGGGN